LQKNLQALFQLLKMRKVKPHIAKRVGLDEVGLSHRKLENGNVRGTVVCLPWKGINRKGIEQPDQEEEA
jgi:D-arabinose 1-dehydrogenase-like Zn-dependent alcohol dehydrogenase